MLINWAGATARSFLIRVISAFLFSTGILAFLAFLTTINGNDYDRMYTTALSVVINLVACFHYLCIGSIRSFDGPRWMSVKMEKKWSPFMVWNRQIGIGVEIMVDSIRHSDWLVQPRAASRPYTHDHIPNCHHYRCR